ncbi:PAS domain S-box protein [Geomonas subterranea]|uniref:histidine kinase n=1 Tax=Geomonas subterranea TaxID=2847989 RepID=A0ABX8LHJ2_9BACT|nr:PAS domain S-box protein [Geomonas subterranea]QXE90934.1 PAS domain S-box protein [Geomonas subterranea]QXM10980.1 PAS domain S-box protein [Geomonas subterranea]
MANKHETGKETGEAQEASQRARDQFFRLMAEQVKDYALILLNLKGEIISWNSGAERITRYLAHEILGKHFSVLHPKEEIRSGAPQRELSIADTMGSIELQGWRLRKDGSRFFAAITLNQLRDPSDEHAGYVLILHDNTERRAAEEAMAKSRTMLERLFETAPDAIVVVDGGGVIRKVNQQAEVIFGYMREELVGQRIELLIPKRFHKRHRQHLRNYFSDPRARKMGIGLELYGRHKNGAEIPVDIMLNPIETQESTWVFAVIRDITIQKQGEAKILELNLALRHQLEQLAATNRELESFSYSVSHDLRAPLRHIIGFVDLLNSKAGTGLDEKSRHYLDVIGGAAKKMGLLIDDLLAFSRMGRSEMMKGWVDLALLVREIVADLQADLQDREVEWEIGQLPVVLGDAAMLRQVLINLIGNAVKFTRSRAVARIAIGAVRQENEQEIFVRDNGVGFDEAYANKLFGLFQRLHANEEFEGTGVGLAIVQRIVLRHGGRVWAEGGVGTGACFWFSLPNQAG